MSYRFMRVMLFFDLPTETTANRKNYRNFRKYLLRTGFIMLQESVYSKLALNMTAANAVVGNVKKNKPPSGLVQVLIVTEKQYSRMEFIVGQFQSDVIDTEDRLVIL